MLAPGIGGLQTTTNHKVIIPFYVYAAFSVAIATVLLLFSYDSLSIGYQHPHILAITHIMTLGWGTMVILGASYQLLPVLIQGKLYSQFLGYVTFVLTALGIPILIIGFYTFQVESLMKLGAIVVNLGVLCYVFNVVMSVFQSKKRNVHAWYINIATLWLFSTTLYGLLLVWNFTTPLFDYNSWHYLTIHAHLGLVGWFLMLVIGVGSRLIPLFMISKYKNDNMLWWVFVFINSGLISFIVFRSINLVSTYYYISIFLIFIGIIYFGVFCFKARKERIRRKVDEQVKTALISVAMMIIPILSLIIVLLLLPAANSQLSTLYELYGFCILFGWITAMIFGMTFKTLPFIVWSKVYKGLGHTGKIPAPKDLFSDKIYSIMVCVYIIGFIGFTVGLVLNLPHALKTATALLVISSFFYLYNVIKVVGHKKQISSQKNKII